MKKIIAYLFSYEFLGTLAVIALLIGFFCGHWDNVILFWTLLAILWYSMETKKLREVTIKRPIISLLKENTSGGYIISLRNYGEGLARDVKIRLSDKVIHKIPLVSGIYSDFNGNIKFSQEENNELSNFENEIYICYGDSNGESEYTTILKWDDSYRDGCQILKYFWK